MDFNNGKLTINTEEKLIVKCFYCGEIFENKLLQNHISSCQLVLEKCPKNCGVYITRNQRDFHLTKQCCQIKINDQAMNHLETKNHDCICCENCCKNFNDTDSELKIIQLRIDDEKRNRLQFEYTWLTELSKLHERYQKNEERQECIISLLSTLQKSISQEEKIRLEDVNNINCKLDRISSQLQKFELCVIEVNDSVKETKTECLSRGEELIDQFDEWRLKQESRLASLRNLNTDFEKIREDHINRSQSMLNLLDLNEVIIENQGQCSEQVKNCSKNIETFKEVLNDENNLISSIWNKQQDQFKCFKDEFKKTNNILQELLVWQKYVKKKLIKIENTYKSEFMLPLQDDYRNCITLYPTDSPVYSSGHLLWCVSDFEEQFEESKLSDVILHSPVFYTSEYGYKLQMRLHPNGLGQWKGRHMIISLHVVPSDWDSLLIWPFKMNATVFVKDQSSKTEKAKDIVKCFGSNIVNKNNESTKILQMFVPHRSLRECSYINNNSIILEARVKIE